MQVEARADHLSATALLLREIMERTGIVERLTDPRNRHLITYPLADLLRTNLLLLGQSWRDQDDADRLRHDPSFRVAGVSAAAPPRLSRTTCCPRSRRCPGLLDGVERAANQEVVREALIEMAQRRLWMENGRRRRKRLMIDVDGASAQVDGQQDGI